MIYNSRILYFVVLIIAVVVYLPIAKDATKIKKIAFTICWVANMGLITVYAFAIAITPEDIMKDLVGKGNTFLESFDTDYNKNIILYKADFNIDSKGEENHIDYSYNVIVSNEFLKLNYFPHKGFNAKRIFLSSEEPEKRDVYKNLVMFEVKIKDTFYYVVKFGDAAKAIEINNSKIDKSKNNQYHLAKLDKKMEELKIDSEDVKFEEFNPHDTHDLMKNHW